MYADEQEQVDGRAEALKLILNEHGTVTHMRWSMTTVWAGTALQGEQPFPDYLDREFVILLEASAGENTLLMPDSPARLERLLCHTGIRDSPQAHSRVVDSTLPGGVISSIPSEHLSINGLNRLCRAAERIAPEDLKTLVQLLADKDHPSQGHPWAGYPMNRGERACRKSLSRQLQ